MAVIAEVHQRRNPITVRLPAHRDDARPWSALVNAANDRVRCVVGEHDIEEHEVDGGSTRRLASSTDFAHRTSRAPRSRRRRTRLAPANSSSSTTSAASRR